MSEEIRDNEKMASSVNEPVGTVEAASYSDVMDYLHSIYILREDKERIAKRLTLEVTQPALADAYERLDHFSLLKKDWDGRGALPISHRVIGNVRKVLMISDNDDWENWMISPAPDGTLALQSKCHTSSISVGDKDFSYYSSTGDKEDWGDNVTFTPNSFLEIMRKIV